MKIDQEILDEARNLWANPDHEVFQLVPKLFAEAADDLYYNFLHAPPVTIQTFWGIFTGLLNLFLNEEQGNPARVTTMRDEQREAHAREQMEAENGYYNLMPGQQELRENRLPFFGHAGSNGGNADDSLVEQGGGDDEQDDDELFIFFPEEEDDEMY